MRQVWYWNKNTIMIYCDEVDALFWVPFFIKLPKPYPHWSNPNAIPKLVKEVKKQLSIMHGVPQEQMDITKISWKHWNIGGHVYNPGNTLQVQNELIEPINNVYLTNSAYSTVQLWVECALENADKILDRIIKE